VRQQVASQASGIGTIRHDPVGSVLEIAANKQFIPIWQSSFNSPAFADPCWNKKKGEKMLFLSVPFCSFVFLCVISASAQPGKATHIVSGPTLLAPDFCLFQRS